jgi:hypothetical protein
LITFSAFGTLVVALIVVLRTLIAAFGTLLVATLGALIVRTRSVRGTLRGVIASCIAETGLADTRTTAGLLGLCITGLGLL